MLWWNNLFLWCQHLYVGTKESNLKGYMLVTSEFFCNFAPSLTSNLYCFMRTKSIETNDYKDVTNYRLWKTLFWRVITTILRRKNIEDWLWKTLFWRVITTQLNHTFSSILLWKTLFWRVITTFFLVISMNISCGRPCFEGLLQRNVDKGNYE